MLSCSDPNGQCYIETSSLDGEKNLKPKQSILETLKFTERDFQEFSGRVSCIPPNPLLFSYEGSLVLQGQERKIALSSKNLVLRAAKVKNIKWVIGAVVYTGLDTKVMKNSDVGKNKATKVEREMNKYILLVLVLQFACVVVTGIGQALRCQRTNNINEEIGSIDCITEFCLTLARYFLLFNTFLPISLIVSLEFVKVGQAYFMEKDKEMYILENNKPLQVFNCSINEDLGQVQYIFSDKTGTLTCNKMEFKMLVVGDSTYGDLNINDNQESFLAINPSQDIRQRKREPTFKNKDGVDYCFEDTQILQDVTQHRPLQRQIVLNDVHYQYQSDLIKECLMILSCCHECVANIEGNTVTYQVSALGKD